MNIVYIICAGILVVIGGIVFTYGYWLAGFACLVAAAFVPVEA